MDSALNEDRAVFRSIDHHGEAPSQFLGDHSSIRGNNARLDSIDGRTRDVELGPVGRSASLANIPWTRLGRMLGRAPDSGVGIDCGWRLYRPSTRFARNEGGALCAVFSARGNVEFSDRGAACRARPKALWILPRRFCRDPTSRRDPANAGWQRHARRRAIHAGDGGLCGTRARVLRRVDKLNDWINGTGLKRMHGLVLLTCLRCDGSAHGKCQSNCHLRWREEWLRPADRAGSADKFPEQAPPQQSQVAALSAFASRQSDAGAGTHMSVKPPS
jgi:hypothetical protein